MGFFNKNLKEIIVYSPVDGKVVELKKVKDEVFAQGMVGLGSAVEPSSSTVYSPIDQATIATAFSTGHAYGLSSKKGPEILVHIGIDTVSMNGDGFESKVSKDDKVSINSTLAEIDLKKIKEKAKGSEIMVLATNDSMNGWKIQMTKESGTVKQGEELYRIVKA
ncbi:MAG: PTS glucose transporter subunit IIA [Mycoplasmataceae bacterium]|nr:PTS glucose transporter subunit IIA [Mycoplasmataceae bacterium]